MNTGKTHENKSKTVAKHFSQKKNSGDIDMRFTNNRQDSLVLSNLNEIANGSPHKQQTAQLKETSNNSSPLVQKKDTEDEELLQGKMKPNGQGMVIQRHPLDNDVIETDSLEDIVNRIEEIAQGNDNRGPIQERVNDLWIRQNTLLNDLRANLELESSESESSDSAVALSKVVSNFTGRLASASLYFSFMGLKTPKVEPYESKVGQHLLGGGGGDSSE